MHLINLRIACLILTVILLIVNETSSKALSGLYNPNSIHSSSSSEDSSDTLSSLEENARILASRGYEKRSMIDYGDMGWESDLLDQLMGEEIDDNKRSPGWPRLRFRLESDGNLRIGRGFGKRSIEDGQKEEYKTPWSSPSIRALNEAEKVLKNALKARGQKVAI